MNRRFLITACIVMVSLSMLVTGCQSLAKEASPSTTRQTPSSETPISPTMAPEKASLIILHTNDVLGYLDPCG